MPVVYIAGPITGVGEPEKKFNELAARLRAHGYQVMSPMELPKGMTEFAYMDICCAMVRSADIVAMLNGWRRSIGSNVEYHLAMKCQKTIYEEDDIDEVLKGETHE
jgi:hypothetical protein